MAPVEYFSLKNGLPHKKFEQLFQHYPILEPLYFDFEKNFHAEKYVDFAKTNWQVPLAFICVYILMIAFVPKLMAKREKGFNLKIQFAYWNLALSLFSFCGMVRTAPHLVYNITNARSFRDTICTPAEVSYGEGACGLWVMLFIFSKIPELGDTAFIVFKKSKLDFLQWYHHITVLLFCWHSYANTSSTGLYFVAMNYSVHAIMYGYFFLKQIDAWPKWVPAQFITVAQIAQMVVGTTVSYFSYVYLKDGYECDVKPENVIAGGLMYGSYLYLFSKFFVDKFILKAKGKGGKLSGASGAGINKAKSTKTA